MLKLKPSLGDYFKLPNPGLRAYFKHVESGNPDDYRTPLFGGRDRVSVLADWNSELQKMHVDKEYPELYSFEQDMRSKVGPMSIQLPLNERMDSIESYYTGIKLPSEPVLDEAIAQTIQFFSKAGGIRAQSKIKTVLGVKNSKDKHMKLSTNSGVWLFTKRKLVVDDTMNSEMDKLGNIVTKDGDHYKNAAILGWRGQEGGIEDDDVKQRVVFMNSFLQNILELQIYQPAIRAIQKNDLIPAYISMDRVDQEVTALFDSKPADDLVICTDFSKFDQHFNHDMQEASLKVLSSLLVKDQFNRDWISSIYPMKFTVPLICSENLLISGPHGMGSGSGGTNFDECLGHKTLQFESAITDGKLLNAHSMAYGDDGILTYPGVTVEHVIQTYTKHGQEMNKLKQYVSTHDCVVLRRWHGMNYRVNGTMVGVYATNRALGRLMTQERYYDSEKWNNKMVILRSLSILENCKWSPYFHEFIKFVIKGDKFRLGLDLPGFYDDKNLIKLNREAIESFGDDFIGYTRSLQGDNKPSGILQWEVVKYLKSLK